MLADLARRGVHVRGLLWRSHPRQAHFSEQENRRSCARSTRPAARCCSTSGSGGAGATTRSSWCSGGARPEDDVAFVGGIDLCHGRRDDPRHHGDPQAVELDPRYGERPPWHDLQLEIRGPAVGDLAHSFRERWSDPTPFDHRNPVRIALRRLTDQPRRPDPLPPVRPDPPPAGTAAVQVLRTYPAKRPPFPFAPEGERSIGRAYRKALLRAAPAHLPRGPVPLVVAAAATLADALRRAPELHLIAVVPRFPEQSGTVAEASETIGRQRVLETLYAAGGDRVAVYDLENEAGTPIYVHAKVCVIDDVWLEVGSDNLNRRSWTHDSELSCAILDADARRPRTPTAPGGPARPRPAPRPRHPAPPLARAPRARRRGRRRPGRPRHRVRRVPLRRHGARRLAPRRSDRHAAARARPPPPARSGVAAVTLVGGLAHRLFVDPDGRPRHLRHDDEV